MDMKEMTQMRCPKCTREYPDNASFCRSCGCALTQAEAPSQSICVSRDRKTLNVLVIVVLMASVTIFPLGGLDYICGRLNFAPYWLFRWCCYPIISGWITLCVLFCLLTKAFRSLIKKGAKSRIVPIGLFGLVAFLWFVPGLRGPFYMSYMQGFRDYVKSNADMENLRIWLRTLNEEDYSGENSTRLQSRLQESLTILRWTGYISAGENGRPEIGLTWGSSNSGRWGVVIGMEDTPIPKSDFGEHGKCVLAVEPGVYVWRELPSW